ncbi:MAG: transmembrane prediction [Novipirellula sp. JB048]
MKMPPEQHDDSKPTAIRHRLWWIVISPLVWSLHFLTCYITSAIWCQKYAATGDPDELRLFIAVVTGIAVLAISVVAWLSFKNVRTSEATVPYDFDDPAERTHFLGYTAFLLSLLSLVATLFTALVYVIVRSCD